MLSSLQLKYLPFFTVLLLSLWAATAFGQTKMPMIKANSKTIKISTATTP